MKDRISNSYSQDSTLSKSRRLYVVTGKGGVGKSAVAMALTHNLVSHGKKALYVTIDQEVNESTCYELNIPTLNLSLLESTQLYIARKLGSTLVASWIMKTPFFMSMFNMVPGLGNLIYMGHMLDLLMNDPELILILDSPSSGHALTLFESSHNFKKMFGSGILVKDIDKMHEFIYNEDNLSVLICSLPTPMALNESLEVKSHLELLNVKNIEIFVNNSIDKMDINHEDLPVFLKKKIKIEKEFLDKGEIQLKSIIPHLTTLDYNEVVTRLYEHTKELI